MVRWAPLLLLLLPQIAQADAWTATQTSRIEGREQADRAQMTYADQRFRIDSPDRSYIIQMKTGEFTFVDHAKKTYARATIAEVVALQKKIISELEARLPDLPPPVQTRMRGQIEAMRRTNRTAPKIKRTGKVEKRGGYNCEIVTWKDEMAKNRACVAKDLPVDVKPFLSASAALASRLAKLGAPNAAPTQALFHLPGLPIHTRREAGNFVSLTEITELKKLKPNPQTFAVPKTYGKRPLGELIGPF